MDALEILGQLRRLASHDEQVRGQARSRLMDYKPGVVCAWIVNEGLLTSRDAAQAIGAALLLGMLGDHRRVRGIVESIKLDPSDGSVARSKLTALANIRMRDIRAFGVMMEQLEADSCEGLGRMRQAAQHWGGGFPDGFLRELGVPPQVDRLGPRPLVDKGPEPADAIAFWVDEHGVIHWWDDGGEDRVEC